MSGDFNYLGPNRVDGDVRFARVIKSSDGFLYAIPPRFDSTKIYRITINPTSLSLSTSFDITTVDASYEFVSTFPTAVAYDSINNYWYILIRSSSGRRIFKFDLANMTHLASPTLASLVAVTSDLGTDAMRVDPAGDKLYIAAKTVSSGTLYKVSRITASTMAVIDSLNYDRSGSEPNSFDCMALDTTNSKLYVGSFANGITDAQPRIVKINTSTWAKEGTPLDPGAANGASQNRIDQMFVDDTATNMYSVSGNNLYITKVDLSTFTSPGRYTETFGTTASTDSGSGIGPDGFLYVGINGPIDGSTNTQEYIFKFDITGSLPTKTDTVGPLPNRTTNTAGDQWGADLTGVAFDTGTASMYFADSRQFSGGSSILAANRGGIAKVQYAALAPPPEPPAVYLPPIKAVVRVGESILLRGSGLTGATSITFNGTAAVVFTVLNDTTIQVQIPVGATDGAVVVTTAGGSTTIDRISVTANAAQHQSAVTLP